MKLRLISAELFLAVASFIVAGGAAISLTTLAELMVFGFCGLAGSATINSYLDRDVDALMSRTVRRPIPSGRIEPAAAGALGISLLAISVIFTAVLINWVTSAIIGIGSALYIFFYTIYLKRRTPNAVLWGGISGAIPALGGWSAYTQSDWLIPIMIFLVVFLWQPSHFWSLSIYYRDDYRTAGIPALSTRKENSVIAFRGALFNIAAIGVVYALYFIGHLSVVFLVIMTGMNIFLLTASVLATQDRPREFYRRNFRFSLLYMIMFLFALVVSGLLSPAVHLL